MQHSGIFLGSEISQGDVDEALFHVIPAPYEASVSYGGGTAAGPQAIIHASDQLETYDGESEPCDLGIHTHAAVDCRGEAADVLERIRLATRSVEAGVSKPTALPMRACLVGYADSITTIFFSLLRRWRSRAWRYAMPASRAHRSASGT